jgi:hypothetical protein
MVKPLTLITTDKILEGTTRETRMLLYKALHKELHGGITTLRIPDYVIYSYRYTYRLTDESMIARIHKMIQEDYGIEDSNDEIQILTLSTAYIDRIRNFYIPLSEKITDASTAREHPQLTEVWEAINTAVGKKLNISDACLVGFPSGDGSFMLDIFESVINDINHCGGLGRPPYSVSEFEIQLGNSPKVVQYRAYDTESG